MATIATASVMGQQEYELQLGAHLPAQAPDLRLRVVRVRSLRSAVLGEARLPLAATARAPLAVQRIAARIAYGPADLVHRCDLRLPPARVEVVTVHDLAPLRFDDEGSLPPTAADALRRARAVICPSGFAAAELRELVGITDAHVVPNGLNPDMWTAPRDADVVPRLGIPRAFVLHAGGVTARKNLSALATGWDAVRSAHPDVDLVLCGPPDPRRDALFGGRPGVHLLGRVPRTDLLALMSEALVVVVPSVYEGFGFPALEAMARGTPVVASARASLPEVCGDAAVLVEPDAAGLATGLITVLDDETNRRRLAAAGAERARRFTWERAAAAHAAVFRAALAGHGPKARA